MSSTRSDADADAESPDDSTLCKLLDRPGRTGLTTLARRTAFDKCTARLDFGAIITGPFGNLPAELIDVVCTYLLRMQPIHSYLSIGLLACDYRDGWPIERRVGLDTFSAFMCTCHGVRAAISGTNRFEVMCRRWREVWPSDALLHTAAPYTTQVKRIIRNTVEQRAMRDAIDQGSLQSAEPSSEMGRWARTWLNTQWRQGWECSAHAPRFPRPESLGAVAGLRGDAPPRLSLVAPKASIFCATPRGAILNDGNSVCVVDLLKPTTVYNPGREFAVERLAPACENGTWVAADGHRIAVCTCPTGEDGNYEITVWDGGGARVRRKWHTSSRDCASSIKVPMGEPKLHKMWMHGGVVWLACIHAHAPENGFATSKIHFVRLDPEGKTPTCRRVVVGEFVCMSVAAENGSVALLDSNPSYLEGGLYTRVEHVHHFDCSTQRVAKVDWCMRYWFGTDLRQDAVVISPNGHTIVVLIRCTNANANHPRITVYNQTVRGTGRSPLPNQRWQIAAVLCDGFDDPNLYMNHRAIFKTCPIADATFTPCSAVLYILFRDEDAHRGGLFALDALRTVQRGEFHGSFVQRELCKLPRQLVWSDRGVFLQTSRQPGVVHIGLR